MSLFTDASLVMIPSGVKDGKLYSIKPDDGVGDFTFTRGSNLAATRVDENGLIEKGRENLLLQSNQFDTTWFFVGAPDLTGNQIGYDGTNDAWSLASTGTQFASVRQNISVSQLVTFSTYAKAGSLDFLIMYTDVSFNSVWFNLANGTIGTIESNIIDASIIDVGDGWYRCSITSRSASSCRLYPTNANATFGTTSGNIYIQDAQLELGLVATDYIETGATTEQAGILENLPRLDYTDSSCPSLLLEPTRTNLVTQSSGYNFTLTRATIGNLTTRLGAVEGFLYSDNGSGTPNISNNTVVYSTGFHTLSVFVDSANSNSFDLRLAVAGGAIFGVYSTFTPSTKTWGVVNENTSYVQAGSGFVDYEDFGNGIFRLTIGANFTASASFFFPVIYFGTGNSNVFIGGIQVEAGSYPTSYIPTYGTSVTRSVDLCFGAGDATTFNDSEGTLFIDFQGLTDGGDTRRLTISDGTTSNRVSIELDEIAGRIVSFYSALGSLNASLVVDGITQTEHHKIALTYSDSTSKIFIDGVLEGTDNIISAIPTGLNTLEFKNGAGTLPMEAFVRQVSYFPTALTDAECVALTTI